MADQVNLLKGNLIKLSFSPNDIASEYCYRQFAELTDAENKNMPGKKTSY